VPAQVDKICQLMRRYSSCKAFCIGFAATFFAVFDVPVFWPILLLYWFVLFFLTMKRQIRHMIKYRYVPFSVGEPLGLRYYPPCCCVIDCAPFRQGVLQDICCHLQPTNLGPCFAGKKTYAGSQGSLGGKSLGKDQNGTK